MWGIQHIDYITPFSFWLQLIFSPIIYLYMGVMILVTLIAVPFMLLGIRIKNWLCKKYNSHQNNFILSKINEWFNSSIKFKDKEE